MPASAHGVDAVPASQRVRSTAGRRLMGRRDGGLPLPAPFLVVMSALSVQGGAGVAVRVIERAGPVVTVWLRLALGAVMLVAVRPAWRSDVRAWRMAILFGVVLAGMNGMFYAAIGRIPLAAAVTFEFWGPLAVAVAGSRRRLDLVWVALAAAGIFTLAGGRVAANAVLGVAFALGAGAFWALYILVGTRLTRAWPDGRGLGVAMLTGGALLPIPAVAVGGRWLLDPWVLGAGLIVALFSSVIPYTLELAAMRSLPPGVFGVLTSLDPAFAALVGLAFLGQALTAPELAAISMVIVASAGASLGHGRAHPVPDEPLVVAD